MIAKPEKLSGLCCSEQPFPTQQEKEPEGEGGRDNTQYNLLPQNNLLD